MVLYMKIRHSYFDAELAIGAAADLYCSSTVPLLQFPFKTVTRNVKGGNKAPKIQLRSI